MAGTFRTPKAPLNMRLWLRYAAGLQSRGLPAVCELPLVQRKAPSETAPEVAAGA